MTQTPRQLAFEALRSIHRGAFADVELDRIQRQSTLSPVDRRFLTQLVYGVVRRQRTLDALIDQLGKKSSQQQPPDLRLILHLGLYQLRYFTHVPVSAAVNTSVDLAKQNGFAKLAGVVNGILRQYVRLTGNENATSEVALAESKAGVMGTVGEQEDRAIAQSSATSPAWTDPLKLPADPVQRLGVLHSYPDWIVDVWLHQFGVEETEKLCEWLNQPPAIDLRVNVLKATVEQVQQAMADAGIQTQPIAGLPQALRLLDNPGNIQELPGFAAGWWMVQDGSAQLVSHLLDPQPGETVIDACAAPGGKTIHIAELMGDQGIVWACDKTPSRLRKLRQNCDRLEIHSVHIRTGDSRTFDEFTNQGDRVLVDAPCSGLGTLHRHADARWRQTPETVAELTQLQTELLNQAATWVKSGGILVYATCTLHPAENEQQIEKFLATHPDWRLQPPAPTSPATPTVTLQGWCKVLPHHHQMDGFFMARLTRS